MKRIQILFVALLFSSLSFGQDTIYVNDDASGGTYDGNSWATAFQTLHNALASASPGDVIWVREGEYHADANNPGDPLYFFGPLISEIAIYGGFSDLGNPSQLSDRNWKEYPSVLTGDFTNGGGQSHRIFYTAFQHDIIIDGFTLENTLQNAGWGNALAAHDCQNVVMSNCIIRNNIIQGSSGQSLGLFRAVASTDIAIENCLIYDNEGADGSVALTQTGSTIMFLNSTIVDNISNERIFNGSDIICVNSIIYNSGTVNATAASYSHCITDFNSGDPNSYNQNPDLDSDYYPLSGSVAIDRGNNASVNQMYDVLHQPRVKGNAVDIGAIEFDSDAPTTAIQSQYCNRTINTLRSFIVPALVAGGLEYKIQLVSQTDGDVFSANLGSNPWNAYYFSIPDLRYNDAYDARMSVKYTDANGNAVWGPWGPVCEITITEPWAELNSNYCNRTINTLSSFIMPNGSSVVASYEIRMTSNTTGQVFTKDLGSSLSAGYYFGIPDLRYNDTYSVEMRAWYMNSSDVLTAGPWGNSCTITITEPWAELNSNYCNRTINTLRSFIMPNGSSVVASYEIRMTSNITGQVFTKDLGSSLSAGYYFGIPDLRYNDTYSVEMRAWYMNNSDVLTAGPWGNSCTITITEPWAGLNSSYCSRTINTLSSFIVPDGSSVVASYEIRMTSNTTGQVFTQDLGSTPSNAYYFSIPDLRYNDTYSVEMRAWYMNSANVLTAGPWGNSCTITITEPWAELHSDYCTRTITTLSSFIMPTGSSEFLEYEMRMTSSTNVVHTASLGSNPSNAYYLLFPGLTNGTYTVQLRARYKDRNGNTNVWGNWGNTCTITVSLPPSKTSGDFSSFSEPTEILIYPNPTSGIFHLRGVDDEVDQISVFGISGQLVQSLRRASANGTAHTIDISDEPAGIYIVEIKNGEHTIRERISKQ